MNRAMIHWIHLAEFKSFQIWPFCGKFLFAKLRARRCYPSWRYPTSGTRKGGSWLGWRGWGFRRDNWMVYFTPLLSANFNSWDCWQDFCTTKPPAVALQDWKKHSGRFCEMSQDAAGVGLLHYWWSGEQPFRQWLARNSSGTDPIWRVPVILEVGFLVMVPES